MEERSVWKWPSSSQVHHQTHTLHRKQGSSVFPVALPFAPNLSLCPEAVCLWVKSRPPEILRMFCFPDQNNHVVFPFPFRGPGLKDCRDRVFLFPEVTQVHEHYVLAFQQISERWRRLSRPWRPPVRELFLSQGQIKPLHTRDKTSRRPPVQGKGSLAGREASQRKNIWG